MSDFEKLVKKHYEKNSNEQISNGSMDHAKILAQYLFICAKEKRRDIKIITGTLEKNFYEIFAEPIQDVLKNNTVSIISEKPCENSSFKSAVENSNNGSIKVIKQSDNTTSLPHFILIGDSAYRLETDDNLKLATASFNRPNVGKFLLKIFNRV